MTNPSSAELLYGRRLVSNLHSAIGNASGPKCAIRSRLNQRETTTKKQHDACPDNTSYMSFGLTEIRTWPCCLQMPTATFLQSYV